MIDHEFQGQWRRVTGSAVVLLEAQINCIKSCDRERKEIITDEPQQDLVSEALLLSVEHAPQHLQHAGQHSLRRSCVPFNCSGLTPLQCTSYLTGRPSPRHGPNVKVLLSSSSGVRGVWSGQPLKENSAD